MKIISKFKDYYDYVAHVYGGGDPKIVYDRRRIGELTPYGYTASVEARLPINKWNGLSFPYSRVLAYEDKNVYYGSNSGVSDWLIVCGKPFALLPIEKPDPIPALGWRANAIWTVFDKDKHSHLVSEIRSWHLSEVTKTGVEQPQLVELSRMIGHPVFRITGYSKYKDWTITIDGDCPILGELGLASVYPAEQLYQDLSYFIVNKMKTSPDMQPPSPMTDKEKVLQHGFDVKQSFRHRK